MKTVRLECSNGNTFETKVEASSDREAVQKTLKIMRKGFTHTADPMDVPEICTFVNGVRYLLDC